MKFHGSITDDRRVKLSDLHGWQQFLADHAGRDIRIDITASGRRSNKANNYYWGVVIENVRDAMRKDGVHITPEQLHHYFCTLFIPVVVPTAHGEALTLPGRSSKLPAKEYGEFVEACIMWAWENMNIVIPEPNTQTQIELT
jgi:hypothetical protein